MWAAGADGPRPRRLTAPGHRDRAPRWSPDGRRIAFVSDRSGKPRLHVLPAGGGEAESIGGDLEPVGAPIWSPDRRTLVVAAATETASAAAYPDRVGAAQPPLDSYRAPVVVTTLHHKLDGVGFYGTLYRQLFAVPADGGAPQQITQGRFHHESCGFTPDGSHVLTLARREAPGDDGGWIRHPYLVPIAGGDPVRILREDFPCDRAALSPDGTRLALVGSGRPFDWVSSNYDLFVLDISAGRFPYSWRDAQNLTQALDRPLNVGPGSDARHQAPPAPPRWSPDGRTLFVIIGSEGESTLYAAQADGLRRASPGDRREIAQPSAVSADGAIAYLAGDPIHPDEVHVLQPNGEERRLTAHNAEAAEPLDFAQPERIAFQGADGWPIEGWLWRPKGPGPHPMVLDVHGGPSGMYGYGFAFAPQLLRSKGIAVLRLNPRASLGYGNRFSLAVVGDWGGKDYQDLMAGIDHVIQAGIADPGRLGVMGWSYGGFMTCWIVTQTTRFQAAIAGACISDHYSGVGTMDVGMDFTTFSQGTTPWENRERLFERSPMAYVDRVRTPVLLLHGEADLRCPVTQSEEFFTALQMLGRESAFVRYPGEPHGFTQPRNKLDRLERQLHWFVSKLRLNP
ncbi:MAG TPA: S9 family peptidase [Bacillota bacterium]|nr:S9 family peptidase [Bacillota bacterium]